MSYANIASTIRTRFATQWATFSPTYRIFNAGEATRQAIINGQPWLRLTIIPGESLQVGFSSSGRRKRTLGTANVQIFVPANTGEGLAQQLSDQVASVWEMSTISGVIFRATSVQRVGVEGAWLQYNAVTPWQADALITG